MYRRLAYPFVCCRKHDVHALPPAVPSDGEEKDEVPLDVPAMMQAIRRIA